MKIFDHWAKVGQPAVNSEGHRYWLVGWAGSNVSQEDAQQAAHVRVATMKENLDNNKSMGIDTYYCGETAVKELIIERFGDTDIPYAAISRNRYGALVLNAARVFIADVDLPNTSQIPDELVPPQDNANFIIRKLYARSMEKRQKAIAEIDKENLENREKALTGFADFHSQYPALSFRVYSTAAGYRIVVTNMTVDPDSADSQRWMEALNSDKLYRKLCLKQQCYRARLTPKPWRLPGCKSNKFYPDRQYAERSELDIWLKTYESKSQDYAVCELVESYGDGSLHDEVAKVMRVHDEYVISDGAKQLA